MMKQPEDQDQDQEEVSKRIIVIFVCVSNTCRSPMAEHLFRKYLKEMKNIDETKIQIISRSLTTNYEPENSSASTQGIEVMRNCYGIDMNSHRSKLLSAEDVRNADVIIPVKRSLVESILYMFPPAMDKLAFFDQDISDPWHQPVHVFQACAEMMRRQFDGIYHKMMTQSTLRKK